MIRLCLFASVLVGCVDGGPKVFEPVGDHYHSVVAKQYVPANTAEARVDALELDGYTGADNQGGMVLATVEGQGGGIQAEIDKLIDRGESIALVDIQTTSFTNSEDVAVTLYGGTNPQPGACASVDDPICRRHLDGHAAFSIDPTIVGYPPLYGRFVDGVFESEPGRVTLPIAALDDTYTLEHARVRVTSDRVAVIAGMLTEDTIDAKVIPFLVRTITTGIRRDCTTMDPSGPSPCGCSSPESVGARLVQYFDNAPHDCAITADEIAQNGLVQSLLAPDLVIDGKKGLSLGLRVDLVPAAF